MTTYEKIKELCEKDGFSISALSQHIPGLSVNKASITGWKNGSKPRPDKIKAIAEYFGVPVSSLTGDSSVDVHSVQDNHGIIGNTHAPVTINGSDAPGGIGEIEREILSICSKLDTKRKAALLARAYELLEEK